MNSAGPVQMKPREPKRRVAQESARSCCRPSDPLKFVETHDVPLYLACQLSGFFTTGSKFVSIARRTRMVSTGDNGIYTS
jgi:hypothetical protein